MQEKSSSRPQIFEDYLYLLCLSLASMSKSDGERYGSVLVKDDSVLGMGYNRAIAHPYFHLDRPIRMGYANHAEIESINDALLNGYDVEGADIYVAGYFPKPHNGFLGKNRLFLKDGAWYTCVRCPKYMEEYSIKNVIVPSPSGWGVSSLAEATLCAKSYQNGTHDKRTAAVSTYHTIDELSESLLQPEFLHLI